MTSNPAEQCPEREPEPFEALEIQVVEDHPELSALIAEELADLITTLETALLVAIQALCDSASELIAAIGEACGQRTDDVLKIGCSSPREWHLYKHAKRYRIRKKYMNRFIRRIQEEQV